MQSVTPSEHSSNPESGKKPEQDDVHALLAELGNRESKEILGHEALRVLRLLWPGVFRVSSPRPLKIGIDKDILATGQVPEAVVKAGLRSYTRLDQYLESTRTGRSRIGLDGNPSGRVRLEEAVNADLMLYSRYCRKNPQRVFVGQLRAATDDEKAQGEPQSEEPQSEESQSEESRSGQAEATATAPGGE